MNNKEIALEILRLVGGERNVSAVNCCSTRLRFALVNEGIADIDHLKKVEGVITVQKSGGQVQVVIGNKADKVYQALMENTAFDHAENAARPSGRNLVNRFIETIASIFTPILPALVGSGMIKALSTVLKALNMVDAKSNFVVIMDMVGDAIFFFLPFFLAVSAARRFKANQYMAMMLSAVLLHPTWTDLVTNLTKAGATAYSFLGIHFYLAKYSSTVIPIILAVFVLKYVNDFFAKYVPEIVKDIFVPLLTLLVMVPLTFSVIGPFGSYVGIWIAKAIDAMFAFSPVIAGFLLGFFRPILVMFGMHYSIMPIQIQQVAASGATVLLPSSFSANLAQAGAAFAVALLLGKKEKGSALTSGISAVFGITEPAIYGFNLKYKIPFFTACLSAGVTSALLSALSVKATSVSLPNILSVGILKGGVSLSIIYVIVILTAVLSFVLSLAAVRIFKVKLDGEEPKAIKAAAPTVPAAGPVDMVAPVKGEMIALAQVQDATFAEGHMGPGYGIIPADGDIVAPCDGSIAALFPTCHAIGITADNGAEILIHIGIDTVKLDGRHFTSFVKQGDPVRKGQLLVRMDLAAVKAEGFDPTTIVVVTNSAERPVQLLDGQKSVSPAMAVLKA